LASLLAPWNSTGVYSNRSRQSRAERRFLFINARRPKILSKEDLDMEKKHNMKTEVFGTLDFNSNGSKTEERIMEASRVKMEGMGPIQVSEMDIESLVIKYHPRINVDGIDELKRSIEKCGLQEPIAVYE